MTPAVIFKCASAASSIAAYFGLIENVGTNVQKLLHAPFKSAISNLQAALNSNAANARFYVRQALIEFNQACSLEENENLISAHVGKAMCQHLLGDTANRDLTMSNIKNLELSTSEKTKAISKTAAKLVGFGIRYAMYKVAKGENPVTSDYAGRVQKFEEYKRLALATK